jgi:20S proteasome subunit alpha 7
VYYGYRGTASGKGKALAKTELEKVLAKNDGKGVKVQEGVDEIARMYVHHCNGANAVFTWFMTTTRTRTSNWK